LIKKKRRGSSFGDDNEKEGGIGITDLREEKDLLSYRRGYLLKGKSRKKKKKKRKKKKGREKQVKFLPCTEESEGLKREKN